MTSSSLINRYNHSLVLTGTGRVFGWGSNDEGQLGLGDTVNRKTPQHLPTLSNIVHVACGGQSSFAIDADGLCKLNPRTYEFKAVSSHGDPTTTVNWVLEILLTGLLLPLRRFILIFFRNSPQLIKAIHDKVIAVASGGFHTLAVTQNGMVFAWGRNDYGQLGQGSDARPVEVPQKIAELRNIAKISCGEHHSMALTRDGNLYVWGLNEKGQLGLGHTDNKNTPQLLTDYVADIACGSDHSLALTKEGSMLVWGYNHKKQLGLGNTQDQISPHEFSLGLEQKIASFGCGTRHSFALTEDGSLFLWGEGTCGALGFKSGQDKSTPHLLANLKFKLPEMPLPKVFPLPSPWNYPDISTNLVDGSEITWHTPVIRTRCPALLPCLDASCTSASAALLRNAPKAVVEEFRSFIYANFVDFKQLLIVDVLALLELSKQFKLAGLSYQCQYWFVRDLSPENAQDALVRCAKASSPGLLEPETSWVIGFLSKNKIPLSMPYLGQLSLEIISRAFQEFATPTIIFPPKIKAVAIEPIEESLKRLYKDDNSDFEIHVTQGIQKRTFKVHKLVLCRWTFFNTFFISKGVNEHETSMPLETFQKLIKYFYTGNVKDFSFKDCGWVTSLASYYTLEDERELLEFCHRTIDAGVTSRNWIDGLHLGIELNSSEIQDRAVEAVPKTVEVIPQLVDFSRNLLTTTKRLEKELAENDKELDQLKRDNALLKSQNKKHEEDIQTLQSQLQKLLERFKI